MASRQGHSYTNVYNHDNSRSHLGDVYNNYGPSPDQLAFSAMLDSLRYDGMDDRLNRLNSAERGTFEWALAEKDVNDEDNEGETYNLNSWSRSKAVGEAFTTWLSAEEEEGSLFSFMGKPGSGKSTLMYETLVNRSG